ncbi:twin-arginine translocation pathway signal [Paracoccus suum]|uniref:Twin-arginine translocation pathway signal n=1 Tax=Paracoccus suum TaxID=2259340 RepID=A0A344PJS6_9RHOB|nr:YSC84-related protein [Paracoccus suum]AXC49631.1 twin-arginine translocation pathway signal [Paracoccus suum]
MTPNEGGITRRGLMMRGAVGTAALLSGAALGGCATGYGIGSAAGIDTRVDATRDYLVQTYPSAAPMVQAAQGVLYMPLVTEAAFGPGAAYGEGALRVGGQTVDYYSAAKATFGVQAGAQQYAHALIFRSSDALAAFRASPGWVAGADAFYALPTGGMDIGADTLALQYPVVAMIFGQSGLMAGAAIEGTKYTRITLSRA